MFYEFDTIKHIKNISKNGVWYGRMYSIKKVRYGTVLSYCLVLFGTCDDKNSRESLYQSSETNIIMCIIYLYYKQVCNKTYVLLLLYQPV